MNLSPESTHSIPYRQVGFLGELQVILAKYDDVCLLLLPARFGKHAVCFETIGCDETRTHVPDAVPIDPD